MKTLLRICYNPIWLSRSFRSTYATTRLAFAGSESATFAFAELSRLELLTPLSRALSRSFRPWSVYFRRSKLVYALYKILTWRFLTLLTWDFDIFWPCKCHRSRIHVQKVGWVQPVQHCYPVLSRFFLCREKIEGGDSSYQIPSNLIFTGLGSKTRLSHGRSYKGDRHHATKSISLDHSIKRFDGPNTLVICRSVFQL